LVSKIPLAGYSYQWGSRLAGPTVGWWLGWMSFAFLSIVTVSVDYALAQVALIPLLGLGYTPALAAAITAGILLLQATLILLSTRVTMKVNNWAVAFELLGVVMLVIMALVAGQVAGIGRWSNLTSTGTIPAVGWYGWLGPFMLATLLGGYTIVGFEASANLAEEHEAPRHDIPRGMFGAVAVSGSLGMLLLIALTKSLGDVGQITGEASPVAAVFRVFFGGAEWLILSWMVLSIFACGMIIMTSNSRLIWAMSRDRRFPLHQLWARTPRATGGPSATILAAAVSATILGLLWYNTDALFTLFTTATLLPAGLYAATTLLYVFERRFLRLDPGPFHLGRWELPVVAGALAWLAYELLILIAPAEFRPAQRYALGAVALGLIVFVVMYLLEPGAMRERLPLPAGADDAASAPRQPRRLREATPVPPNAAAGDNE
jgi:amino acid transporter